jgi:uncharacterized protein
MSGSFFYFRPSGDSGSPRAQAGGLTGVRGAPEPAHAARARKVAREAESGYTDANAAIERATELTEDFYEGGLRFECQRCSSCCRYSPGYVFLSPGDLERLACALGLSGQEVLARYCRKVSPGGIPRVSLREKPNMDCIFWEGKGCRVYRDRPIQCRSFPFWSAHLGSQAAWDQAAADCPGMNRGPLHSAEVIRGWLDARREEGFL